MMNEDTYQTTRSSRSSGRRLVVAAALILFLAVLVGAAWVVTNWSGAFGGDQSTLTDGGMENGVTPAPPSPAANPTALPTSQPAPASSPPPEQAAPAPVTPEALDSRMLDMEQRLLRVSVAAQSASGYANRAEAIMVAFAARRKLDAGAPLDYIETQLRLLFGDAQPKAVATIINAAAEPVTVNKLRAGLQDITLLIEKGDPNEGWWSSTMRTLGGLIEIRHAGDPEPDPEQRLARARRDVEAGQIEDAIGEMAALPPQPAISQWLEQARRYNEARRALDVIEAAAILEPRTAPLVTPIPTEEAAPAKK